MLKSLYTSATGMKAQQVFVDTISNNLANVNTTGFKRNTVSFQDLLYVTYKQPGLETVAGRPNPMGLQLGSGARLVGTPKVHTQGVLEGTNRSLDVAIKGDGFFQVQLPDATIGYTRDGSFLLDSEGHLVTSSGYRLDPDITIPSDALRITIDEDGQVWVTTSAAHRGEPGEQWSRVSHPELPGAFQRGGGERAGQPDRRPEGLRGQLQGDQDER